LVTEKNLNPLVYTFSKLYIQTTVEKEPLYEQNTRGCYNSIKQEGVPKDARLNPYGTTQRGSSRQIFLTNSTVRIVYNKFACHSLPGTTTLQNFYIILSRQNMFFTKSNCKLDVFRGVLLTFFAIFLPHFIMKSSTNAGVPEYRKTMIWGFRYQVVSKHFYEYHYYKWKLP